MKKVAFIGTWLLTKFIPLIPLLLATVSIALIFYFFVKPSSDEMRAVIGFGIAIFLLPTLALFLWDYFRLS